MRLKIAVSVVRSRPWAPCAFVGASVGYVVALFPFSSQQPARHCLRQTRSVCAGERKRRQLLIWSWHGRFPVPTNVLSKRGMRNPPPRPSPIWVMISGSTCGLCEKAGRDLRSRRLNRRRSAIIFRSGGVVYWAASVQNAYALIGSAPENQPLMMTNEKSVGWDPPGGGEIARRSRSGRYTQAVGD